MDARVGLFFLALVSFSWAGDGRTLVTSDGVSVVYEVTVMEYQNHYQQPEKGLQSLGDFNNNENLCTLCEEFTTQAVEYFKEKKNREEIIDLLHKTCSQIPFYSKRCVAMVDYYAPLFFLEISNIQPHEFCSKYQLCMQLVNISQVGKRDSCDVCHRTVGEVLLKLKDPDTQIEIIETILKMCNSMENYAKKCKMMVFQYGPLALANVEQFLEAKDLCSMIRACDSPTGTMSTGDQALLSTKASMLADA